MRHIDQDEVRRLIPADWAAKAAAALASVTAKTEDKSRVAEVDRNSAIWRDLKRNLADVSTNKCWYCETEETRSDNAVDHYRPKNAVAEKGGHKGYWWLAFTWENYRFTCTYCNSRRTDVENNTTGGKHDHFPLWDESCRACGPTDDCDREQPMLLDPCCPADPPLLWFDEDGRSRANPTQCHDANGYASKRADRSIDLYHLNHTDLVEKRLALCNAIRRDLRDADVMLQKASEGDMTARQSFGTAIRQVSTRLARSSPHSTAARCMVMGLRGESPAANAVLQVA